VRGKVIYNILKNWEELKANFTSAELAQSQFDTKFKDRHIKEMLSDYKNYLFFKLAIPIVQQFERLNGFFGKPKLILMNCANKYFYVRRFFRTDCMMSKERKKNIKLILVSIS
jgi:hypothetical protein